jgi:Rieske Fe-S protein
VLLVRYLLPRREAGTGVLAVHKDEIPPNGALVFREARIAFLREGEQIYALSLVCTHLGCTLTVTSGRLVCPCHGSVFDRQGNVLEGPATRSLDRLPIEEQGETVAVRR